MLRITPTEKASSLGLRLEGRLEGPWVEVLRQSWTDAIGSDGHGQLSVDLGAVSFADSDGRTLLLSMQQQGVALVKASSFLQEILKASGPNPNRHESEQKGA